MGDETLSPLNSEQLWLADMDWDDAADAFDLFMIDKKINNLA